MSPQQFRTSRQPSGLRWVVLACVVLVFLLCAIGARHSRDGDSVSAASQQKFDAAADRLPIHTRKSVVMEALGYPQPVRSIENERGKVERYDYGGWSFIFQNDELVEKTRY